MDEVKVFTLLERVGAIQYGHFVGTSGDHLRSYFCKEELYFDSSATYQIACAIGEHFLGTVRRKRNSDTKKIDIVLTPAVGGIVLGQQVAHYLTRNAQATGFLYTKVVKGRHTLSDWQKELLRDKIVLLVDNIWTTGKTFNQCAKLIRGSGGILGGAGFVWISDPHVTGKIGLPPREVYALIRKPVDRYKSGKGTCIMCDDDIPISPKP
jgi:orotate phosphoribosyltransferase